MDSSNSEPINQDKFKLIRPIASPRYRVLFLGYAPHETRLIQLLIDRQCAVYHCAAPVSTLQGFDCIISFGYRHILSAATIDTAGVPIFNLHISYLPYNRGAHPNFWAHFNNTPNGVTIHLIDKGIDTGDICYQREVQFAPEHKTFAQTYQQLIENIEALFETHVEELLSGTFPRKKQCGQGSYHARADLPEGVSWDAEIQSELARLKHHNNTKTR